MLDKSLFGNFIARSEKERSIVICTFRLVPLKCMTPRQRVGRTLCPDSGVDSKQGMSEDTANCYGRFMYTQTRLSIGLPTICHGPVCLLGSCIMNDKAHFIRNMKIRCTLEYRTPGTVAEVEDIAPPHSSPHRSVDPSLPWPTPGQRTIKTLVQGIFPNLRLDTRPLPKAFCRIEETCYTPHPS